MKILWNIHLYPPAHNCGSENVAHYVNKHLISQGHQVRVILQRYTGAPYIYDGVEVFPTTGNLDAFRWADIICTHLDFTQYTIVLAASVKKPLVHFVHNDITYNCIQNAGKGTFIVYNAEWAKAKMNYDHPSFVLHPPCDPDHYAVESSREFITLVSLNERKGGMIFYEIIKAMPEKRFLGVVGSYDNPIKYKQSEIIDKLLSLPNFTLVENSPDILSTYRRTRILLMPSDYESWGRTATEAMCSGIPVVCTPTPGLKENCGEAGIYVGTPKNQAIDGGAHVDTGKISEWVDAIRRLDDEKEYEKYSLLCRQRAQALDPKKELEDLHSFLVSAAG